MKVKVLTLSKSPHHAVVFEQRSNQYINLENNDKGNNDLVNNFQDPHKK